MDTMEIAPVRCEPDIVVQRYRRTDQDRLGQWAPVDASWKFTANSGLVAHDIYHHLPGDTGTFAQEVAALGAEWYIDVQDFKGEQGLPFSVWPVSNFERNVRDTVLNALDSKEVRAFDLQPCEAAMLGPKQQAFFEQLARKASELLANSSDERAQGLEDFEQRFVQNLLKGYWQARERFPDQRAVRQCSRQLALDLSYLEETDVPYGHEVTLTLQGHLCSISYTDADEDVVEKLELVPAVMMTWCSSERGFPDRHVTVHRTAQDYADFLHEHFSAQDEDLPDEQRIIPRGEQYDLMKVYIRDAKLQEQLQAGQTVQLPLELMHMSDYTPRGFRII